MKNILFILFAFSILSSNALTVKSISNQDVNGIENAKYINFNNFDGIHYADEVKNFIFDFDFQNIDSLTINDSTFYVQSNELLLVSGLELGDYSFATNGKSKSIKYKQTASNLLCQ